MLKVRCFSSYDSVVIFIVNISIQYEIKDTNLYRTRSVGPSYPEIYQSSK